MAVDVFKPDFDCLTLDGKQQGPDREFSGSKSFAFLKRVTIPIFALLSGTARYRGIG